MINAALQPVRGTPLRFSRSVDSKNHTGKLLHQWFGGTLDTLPVRAYPTVFPEKKGLGSR